MEPDSSELVQVIASQQATIARQAASLESLVTQNAELRAECAAKAAELDRERQALECRSADARADLREMQASLMDAWGRETAELRGEVRRLQGELARAAEEGRRFERLAAQVAELMTTVYFDPALIGRRMSATVAAEEAMRREVEAAEAAERGAVLGAAPEGLRQYLFILSQLGRRTLAGEAHMEEGAAARQVTQGYLEVWRTLRAERLRADYWRCALRNEMGTEKVRLRQRGGRDDAGGATDTLVDADDVVLFVREFLSALPQLRSLTLHGVEAGVRGCFGLGANDRLPGGSFSALETLALWCTPYAIADLAALLHHFPTLQGIDVHTSSCTSWAPHPERDLQAARRALHGKVSFW